MQFLEEPEKSAQELADELLENYRPDLPEPPPTPPAPPEPYALACKRIPVASLYHKRLPHQRLLPDKFIEQMEQNQQIASCCRHPENHEISAWYSNEEHKGKGLSIIALVAGGITA